MDSPTSSRERGFEVTDAPVPALLIAFVIVVVGTAASMGVVRLMMMGPENAPAAFGVADHVGSFTHGPAEQTSIQQSWEALDRELAQTMSGYGWVDREQGVVRLPIARAMELVVAENGGPP